MYYSKQPKVIGRPRECVNLRFVSYHLHVDLHCRPCTWHAGHCEVDWRKSYSAETQLCGNEGVLSARLGRRTIVLFRTREHIHLNAMMAMPMMHMVVCNMTWKAGGLLFWNVGQCIIYVWMFLCMYVWMSACAFL
jgi:hypothetical protein